MLRGSWDLMRNMGNRLLPLKITAAAAGVVVVASVGYVLVCSSSADAHEPLGRNVPPSQQVSMDAIDHSAYDALLNKHVDEDGYVAYAAWRDSAADRQALRAYLDRLSAASMDLPATREAQLAFWINAYNAVTLEGILQVYPTVSIRNHTSRFGGYNIWKDLPLIVGGRQFSLDDMEHRVLRPMGESRIHFAIVCASVGCPRLRGEAYTAEQLDEQLADNARDFFSRPQNLRVEGNTIYLSSILNWFGSDFGENRDQQLQAVQPYFPAAARQLAADSRTRVRYLDYDWSLNDQSRKPANAGPRGSGSSRR